MKLLYIFDEQDWKTRIKLADAARDRGVDVQLAHTGNKPFTLHRLIAENAPDLVHAVTLKYAFFTGLALIFHPHIHRIYTLAGLGYLFRAEGWKPKFLRFCLSLLLKLVLRHLKARIIFQNPDDRDLMIKKKYVRPEQCYVILGSGVDLNTYTPPAQEPDGRPIVLMPTRLVHGKGVRVFIEAAKILAARGVEVDFQIAGGETNNPEAISKKEMEDMLKGSPVTWLGRVDDMPTLLGRTSLVVYPSYYGEGIPRVLLEAAACGRAIITTDHPGCREAVQHGENGLLVPVKDVQATADAMQTLLNDPERRTEMGQKSRALAETQFDIHHITQETLKLYVFFDGAVAGDEG